MNHRFKAGALVALLVVALLAICFGSMTVNAQVLYGSITGTVSDRTGAVIPGGTVTITDQGTKAVRSATVNGQGTYLFLDV
ncbi:MAG: carboxypeptidase-like regulatory domain-containing protein, partial [Terracidiphilus sp.]